MKRDEGEFFGSLGPVVIRQFGIAYHDNFDRMTDDYRIYIRHASDFGDFYEKDIVFFSLPRGTPTPGLDALSWLLSAVENKERQRRKLNPSSTVEYKEEE